MSLLCERILAVMPNLCEDDPKVDWVDIMWNDLDKRAIGRTSRGGRTIRIILRANQTLEHGAVLARVRSSQIVVNVPSCETVIVAPKSAAKLAECAYVIGNLHIPAQIEAGKLIVPADLSTEAALGRAGIKFKPAFRRFRPMPNALPQLTLAGDLAR